jgi:enamine deaminase RidA (YjgF/YER057c/UK114 family)
MPKQHIDPDGLYKSQPLGYSQVVTSPPGTLVFLAGQVALDPAFKAMGSSLAQQAEGALSNVATALAAAGGARSDVTSLRIYIADYRPEHAGIVGPIVSRFFEGAPPPAQTMVGVQALGMPDLKIEIEAIAVIEGGS